jgi:hypothetical protein
MNSSILLNTKTKGFAIATFLASSVAMSSIAQANAIIKYGDTYLGVNNEGHLNVNPFDVDGLSDEFLTEFGGAPVGLWRQGLGDATSPGCLCEGWGVAATIGDSRFNAGANISSDGGAFGLDGGVFGSTDTSITSLVNLNGTDVSVTHAYGFSLANGVFQGSVTIRNNTDSVIEDLVYRRVMDWDIPPTEFNEFVTHGGVEANLESVGGNVRFASDNGFASANPDVAAGSRDASTVNSDFVDNGPSDHGSVFDFAFGELEAGDSRTFNIFYGSTASEEAAFDALDILQADVYSLGQQAGSPDDGEPATFLFAFGGVGGVELGTTPDNPVLPFVPAPGEFVFVSPEPGFWFDPPYAEGFAYELEGGATFTLLETPDASFGFGDLDLYIDDMFVATIAPGGVFDFTSLPSAVSSFRLVGLDRLLDVEDPGFSRAFPLFLDWTGTASTLTMDAIIASAEPVSSPATFLFIVGGFALFITKRKYAK